MIFRAPEWFILIPLLAALGWWLPRIRLWHPLRVALLTLVVLILVQPQIRRLARGMDLWVLVDRSASAEKIVARDAEEWQQLLARHKPTASDRLHFIDYASNVLNATTSESANLETSLTRTNLAIHHALAQVDPNRHSRILVFSDGFSTEPLAGVREKLLTMKVPLDYRLLGGDNAMDVQITALQIPNRQQVSEPFIVQINLKGNSQAPVPLTLLRNGQPLAATEVTLVDHAGEIRFTDRIDQPGAYRYEAIITPSDDAFVGNNHYQQWVEITGGQQILLITKYNADPIATILSKQGYDVQVVTKPSSLHVGQLTGTKAVILNNVGAFEIESEFLQAIDFYVRNQGGGLLMCGGKQSFGSGGYFQSAIDDLLPVSLELKNEHRKLATVMAIVMDRSGSMAMTVESGESKMQLADEGAARAIELLGEQDVITVFAVDSEAHEIIPPLEVGLHRDEIISRVRRIESRGGGIFVFNGLRAAWDKIKTAELGQRHIILFADAADSEQPGQYKSLVKTIVDKGGSISVIGLGDETDPDADFLKDIAQRGNGRMFFTREPRELPNIFAQETVSVARSTFVSDTTEAQPTGGWFELTSEALDWLPSVDGYNLSYLRNNATSALLSKDEYTAPLVAFAQRGIGRSAAVSFPMGGDFSAKVRDWQGLGDFVQTLTRWLSGEEIPPGIGVRTKIRGTELTIDLFYDEDWNERLAITPPRCLIASASTHNQPRPLTWQRLMPGHFSTTLHLEPGKTVRGAIQVGSHALSFGPLIVGSTPEWNFDRKRLKELKEVSTMSGGRALVDLADAWVKPDHKEFEDIRSELLILLLILFLIEVIFTRLGWRVPKLHLAMPQPRLSRATIKKSSTTKISPPTPSSAPTAPKGTTSEKNAKKTRSRFHRAKRRK